MNTTNIKTYHVHILKREFQQRQRINPSFSLRAYARFLELDASALSAIFKSKRFLPKKYAEQVLEKLDLDILEKNQFLESVLSKNKKTIINSETERKVSDGDYLKLLENSRNFDIIAEWEHYAILTLMESHSFIGDIQWIQDRLNIDFERCKKVIRNLIDSNLIIIDPTTNKWHKNFTRLETTDGVRSKALRQSHRETLNLALQKIETIPLDQRSFSSTTINMPATNIEQARELIKSFRRDMTSLMENTDSDDVYNLSIQLFPLTEVNKNRGSYEIAQ